MNELEKLTIKGQITSVNYSRLANLGNYENEKVGASARVDEGQDPDIVLSELRQWVDGKLQDIDEYREMEERRLNLTRNLGDLEGKVAAAGRMWEKAQTFLRAHGLEPPSWPRFEDDF